MVEPMRTTGRDFYRCDIAEKGLSNHMQVFLIRPSLLKHLSNGLIPEGSVELGGTTFIWRESGYSSDASVLVGSLCLGF